MKLVCSSICSEAVQNPRLNYSHYFCHPEFSISPAEIILDDCECVIIWNGYNLGFTPAKGHSNSGIFFSIENTLFTGDTLIKDKETIIKFKTGSHLELEASLSFLESCKGKGFKVYP